MRKTLLLLSAAGIAALSACTNDEAASAKYAHVEKGFGKLAAVGGPVRGPIQKTDRIYIGDNYVDNSHGDPLPDNLEAPDGFIFTGTPRGGAFTLAELAQRITRYTGMTVLIEPEKVEAGQVAVTPTHPAHPARDSTIATIDDLVGAGGAVAGGQAVSSQLTSRTLMAYQGPLSGFLAREIPGYGKDWDVKGNFIYVGTDVVRSYPVVDMPSSTTISAGLSGSSSSSGSSTGAGAGSSSAGPAGTSGQTGQAGQSGSSSGSGSSGGQNTVTTTSINGWSDLLSTLAAYAGAKEKVFPEPSNGLVTVKCPLYCQAQVSSYIQDHNSEAGRSVLLTVAILSVQKTGSDTYGIQPNLIYNNLPTGYTLSVLGQTSAVNTSTGGAFTAGVVNPPAGSTAAKFNGTSLAVQAVSQDQQVTGTFGKYGFTANNRVFSVRNALDYSYPQSIVTSQNVVGTIGGVSLVTQVIGDQLQIIPRLLPNGMIRLQLALSRTAIQSKDTYTEAGTTTIAPQISDNSGSAQEFNIRDGATLILSDIGDDNSNRQLSGAGSVFNWLLGGQAAATNSRDRTVLIVNAREWHGGDETPGIEDLQ